MPLQINWPAIGFTALPNLGGVVGGLITRQNVDKWYSTLKRRDWYPPNWVFGPMWTSLYCGMGYASYLVYRDGGGFGGPARLPLAVYGANLAVNWAWSPIFFGLHNIKLALADIALIDITAIGVAVLFYRVNRTAGLLIAPYCLWLGLATTLNALIVKDNPDDKPEEKTI